MPLIAMGVIGAIGSIGGAAIAANAAGHAANTQADAALQAQQLQKQEADQALAFQKQQWQTQQQNIAPWLSAGKNALGSLQGLITDGFHAPTDVTEQNDPGYKFRLQQGMEALQNSAAARGGLLSGNTAKALEDYSQNYASNEYGNVYNRALGEFQQKYNMLAGLSGTGQMAANQLGQEGQAASGNMANILLGTGAQQGQDINNAAAARASGYIGAGNAWGGAFGGASNNLMSLLLLKQLFPGAGSSGFVPPSSGDTLTGG